jgi:hypothetical protein
MHGALNRSAVAGLLLAAVALSPNRLGGQKADSARALVIHISIAARRLWVVDTLGDTLLAAQVSVGSGKTLKGDTRSWTFRTPTGKTRVTSRERDPLWVPPDWYYVELAKERGLRIERLSLDTPFTLTGERSLVVRNWQVGTLGPDAVFRAFPSGSDVIVDGTLFIPPFGTGQRKMGGILGSYRLGLANGVGLHGTPYKDSIGKAVTHGCIRLHDADITWLYDNVPIGTVVIIR